MNLYISTDPTAFTYVRAYRVRTCGISFFHMTYRRDYRDVDPSLRFEPITHREYIRIPFLCSLSSGRVYRRTHRSSLRPRFFIGMLERKKKKKERERDRETKIEKPFRRLGTQNQPLSVQPLPVIVHFPFWNSFSPCLDQLEWHTYTGIVFSFIFLSRR